MPELARSPSTFVSRCSQKDRFKNKAGTLRDQSSLVQNLEDIETLAEVACEVFSFDDSCGKSVHKSVSGGFLRIFPIQSIKWDGKKKKPIFPAHLQETWAVASTKRKTFLLFWEFWSQVSRRSGLCCYILLRGKKPMKRLCLKFMELSFHFARLVILSKKHFFMRGISPWRLYFKL